MWNWRFLSKKRLYILDEPMVSGFDFNKKNGESSRTQKAQTKKFLIGKWREKKEINDDPIILGLTYNYSNPLETIRKGIVDDTLEKLPKRESVDLSSMCFDWNQLNLHIL